MDRDSSVDLVYRHAPADYHCRFCLIASGIEEPGMRTCQADVVFRDDLVTAFIAADWRLNNPGHVLVIPNRHSENLYELPSLEGGRIQDVVRLIALGLKRSYLCDGISTVQHNEPAGNQDVWHFHVHVFPRYEGDELYRSPKRPTTPEERYPFAEKLKGSLMRPGGLRSGGSNQLGKWAE